ncbi:unnamed protein product [Microthlaspi erraticum]|uniref:Uncharacterized protein n=1 Tax=Microthlaspi erraticum TaxID=1685480 RepID=A0A6D2HX78_9BRAS|nr:unnamed protein product [Microthlaspi erraticum]
MATEYERKRLENIKRNDEMLAALNVQAKASLLSAATKRPRAYSKKKKKKPETPIVIRKSLRSRGLDPDGSSDKPKRVAPPLNASPPVLDPLVFDEAYSGNGSYTQFAETFLSIAVKQSCRVKLVKDEDESPMVRRRTRSSALKSNVAVKKERSDFDSDFPVKPEIIESESGFDIGSLSLEPHNVASVVPGRILVVKFLPCEDVKMVAAGDKLGNVGFWSLDSENEDQIHLFQPHTAPVTSLVFQQNSFSKVISSSYDGLVRLMDVEKLVFDVVCSSDDPIISLSQRPNDEQSLYIGDGYGMLNVWDLRAGKSVSHWRLHGAWINSIDFNPQNPSVMATSSTDRTACLWDLRSMGATKPTTLRTVSHRKAVHSAYFSPSGLSLATTFLDNYVGILSGANYEDSSMIYHDNSTNLWISSFRGVWGWDDSYIFVGNQSKRMDVISPKLKYEICSMQNPLPSS